MSKTLEITVECPVFESYRVAQVGGMFDVPITKRSVETFRVEAPPLLAEPWKIGLIVGPSGSGKSTVAEHLYGDGLYRGGDWPADRAVVDHLGAGSIKDTTRLLTAVGFSSPPGWIKPYRVLSNGERFRCDLARALARAGRENEAGPVVYDEYTSVVDRNVAKICSAAVAKGIKAGQIDCRFVAVTCHYDVADWLEPDWVLDMATGTVARRSLRRPGIKLEIRRCGTDAWPLFKRHHYLSGNLNPASLCYLATWNGAPVAFCALLAHFGHKGRRRISRIVTLPDYQGIGIGGRFLDAIAQRTHLEGFTLSIVASHPSIIHHCGKSPLWRCSHVARYGFRKQNGPGGIPSRESYNKTVAADRATVSFVYDPAEKRARSS